MCVAQYLVSESCVLFEKRTRQCFPFESKGVCDKWCVKKRLGCGPCCPVRHLVARIGNLGGGQCEEHYRGFSADQNAATNSRVSFCIRC